MTTALMICSVSFTANAQLVEKKEIMKYYRI